MRFVRQVQVGWACLLILAWIFVVFMMFRAVYLKQILWPQKGEDRDEGGYHSEDTESRSTSAESPQPQNNVSRDVSV